MEQELEILQQLVMKDKLAISSSLRNLHEGNLVFPRAEMKTFLRSERSTVVSREKHSDFLVYLNYLQVHVFMYMHVQVISTHIKASIQFKNLHLVA